MGRTVNVGVIGVGRIGALHLRHLATRIPEAHVVAVADVRADIARQQAAAYGVPEVYEDAMRVVSHPEVEAVVVCSSTDTHADLIKAAAEAGKDIFCEKPIDLDLDRIDAALEAVSDAGVRLMVGFNRRFDRDFRRAKELVEDGVIGKPELLHIISRDPSPPPLEYLKVSGGIFLDMTIHDFDMARYLMGSEIVEVYTAGGVMVDPAIAEVGDLDTVVITLRFANGAIGTIDNSRRAAYGYDQRVEVFGSQGVVRTENEYPNTVWLADSQNVRRDLPLHFFMERYVEAYVEEMQTFIRCVAEDREPPVTGEDGRIAIALGMAARRSYEASRPVSVADYMSS